MQAYFRAFSGKRDKQTSKREMKGIPEMKDAHTQGDKAERARA